MSLRAAMAAGVAIGIALYFTFRLVDTYESVEPALLALMWLGGGLALARVLHEDRLHAHGWQSLREQIRGEQDGHE